jgi:LytS/YehU family sensor histidine kinase
MSILLTLLVYVIIFALIWWLISIIPFPPPIAQARWVFYVVLVIIAIFVLLSLVGAVPGLGTIKIGK